MKFLVVIAILTANLSFGQELCDSVYEAAFVDKPAHFSDESKRLDFFIDELVPVLYENEIPTSFHMILFVDSEGQVTGIKGIRNVDWEDKADEILQILRKEEWTPALLNGESVCSEAYFVYSCILLK